MSDEKNLNININPNQTPILYTDNILMSTNDDGFILNFCQKIGGHNQVQIISRIGMSRTHAKKFVKKMSELLAITEGSSQTGKSTKN